MKENKLSIKDISIILTSSIIINLLLSLLYSSILKLFSSLFHPKNLCIVVAGKRVASLNLLLALPVGASKDISFINSSSFNLFNNLYNCTIDLIIVVFPVPGPPVIISKLFSKAFFIAVN